VRTIQGENLGFGGQKRYRGYKSEIRNPTNYNENLRCTESISITYLTHADF
jgi:hypothetical protein